MCCCCPWLSLTEGSGTNSSGKSLERHLVLARLLVIARLQFSSIAFVARNSEVHEKGKEFKAWSKYHIRVPCIVPTCKRFRCKKNFDRQLQGVATSLLYRQRYKFSQSYTCSPSVLSNSFNLSSVRLIKYSYYLHIITYKMNYNALTLKYYKICAKSMH